MNEATVNNFVGLFIIFLPRVVLFRVATLHNVIVATELLFSWVSRVLLPWQKRLMVVGVMNKWTKTFHYHYYVSILCVILLILSGNIYGLEIWHEIFWGINFGPGIFLDFVWSPRDFGCFEFCPHSIIPVNLNPEYSTTTPPQCDSAQYY